MISRLSGESVSYGRRFWGDFVLEGILFVITLGIGWLIWLAIVAPRGQTPAKQLLNVYIHDSKTGERATAGKVWLREGVCKNGIEVLISLVLVGVSGSWDASNYGALYSAVGALWIFSEARRALWDHLAGTIVRYHPYGLVDLKATVAGLTEATAGPAA
jgi:uncharacterized RDD family membrane protein YckC